MRTLFFVIKTYKLNLLLSITIAIVILSIKVERDIIEAGKTLIGSLLGTFILDMEFILTAYWLTPKTDFSQEVRSYISRRDFVGFMRFIQNNKYLLEKKLLHSVFFQIILALTAFFLASSSTSSLGQALALSAYAQSLYLMFEEYEKRKDMDSWFWMLKDIPDRKSQYVYIGCMLVILLFTFSQIY